MGNPVPLKQNANKSFQGSIVLGKGFVLSSEQALELIAKDPRNKEVLFPYLNGDDLNNDPSQQPSRWVINFFDWPEEKARSYSDCFEIVERLVKPERTRWKLDEAGNEIVGTYALRDVRVQKWWQYGERATKLYETISKLDQVMVVPLVSKYSCFDFSLSGIVFMHKLAVIASDDLTIFGILTSAIHNIWCWKNSSTLGAGTLNYSTTDCFDTFPFPENNTSEALERASKQYYLCRKNLLVDLGLGLTKLFNQFHNRRLTEINPKNDLSQMTDKQIEKLYGKDSSYLIRHLTKTNSNLSVRESCEKIIAFRQLSIELDNTVLKAYGWDDIKLRHDFYEMDNLPENDRIRLSIHSDARKEILKRLLLLNHARHNREIQAKSTKPGKGKVLSQTEQIGLFSDSDND